MPAFNPLGGGSGRTANTQPVGGISGRAARPPDGSTSRQAAPPTLRESRIEEVAEDDIAEADRVGHEDSALHGATMGEFNPDDEKEGPQLQDFFNDRGGLRRLAERHALPGLCASIRRSRCSRMGAGTLGGTGKAQESREAYLPN